MLEWGKRLYRFLYFNINIRWSRTLELLSNWSTCHRETRMICVLVVWFYYWYLQGYLCEWDTRNGWGCHSHIAVFVEQMHQPMDDERIVPLRTIHQSAVWLPHDQYIPISASVCPWGSSLSIWSHSMQEDDQDVFSPHPSLCSQGFSKGVIYFPTTRPVR